MPRNNRPTKEVPEGYVCKACNEKGHWVFDCKFKVKKRKVDMVKDETPSSKVEKITINSDKQRVPSRQDIIRAQEIMPVIRVSEAPTCICGDKARARKCRNKESTGYGLMFWWCAKSRNDETRCNFAKIANVIKE
mmetsp:Transcript_21858/g.28545  ORF Transcript_21858/g.28545 Transcript_21858/m.28545 type:complete len:135 (-) Transcript_21858:35-439(-)